MVPPNNLGPDLAGKPANETLYRGMIGSLMYLTATRPDIQFLTCLCAIYQASLKESHLIAVKRIFMYLKGTPSLSMWEFWCTAIAYDLSLLSDDSVAHPLKEYLIKFLVMNGNKPLTLDFKTFYASTVLDYNNGKYIARPSPKAVKAELTKIVTNATYLDNTTILKNSFHVAWRILYTFVIHVLDGNYSSTEQINSIQQMIAYCLITGTKDPSKVTEIELTASMIVVDNLKTSMSPLPFLERIRRGSTGKIKPLPEGPREDKDSEILKPFADMESQTSPVTALLIADAMYQVDQTQSTRFEVSVPYQNKGKTSSEVEPDSQTLVLTIAAEVGDEMDKDIQQADKEQTQSPKPSKESSTKIPIKEPASQEHQSPTPPKEKLESSHARDTDTSDSESSSCLETFRPYDNFVPVTERMKKMAKSNNAASGNITNLTKLLKNAQLPEVITKLDAFQSTLTTLSTYLKAINLPSFHQRITTMENMQADISSIKGMVTEMFQAFNGMTSSTSSSSAYVPTAKQPKVNPETKIIGSSAGLVIDITLPEQPESPPAAPKADKGKGITTDDTESPKKFVKASTVVRLDPDEPVRHFDKEEKIKKAAKEAKLMAMTNSELIKVIHEEASKAGINPKTLENAKGGQEFKKIRDAELKVLNR
ncbi:hypothetical protein Tco_0115088 [Tanacetum coccineum]